MRVLVTGGCGYIGSTLVPQLLDDDQIESVSILDNLELGTPRNLLGTGLGNDASLSFNRGDVREYGHVENAMRNVDTVIHLAAITGADSTHERRDETFAVNLDGTKNVLKAAGKLSVENVVFASSCNNYGRAASTDITEETTPDPLNPYAETKWQAESLLQDAINEYGFDGTALRMSTNYGYAPGVRFNLVVNYFVFRALTQRPLTVYGDGSNWRPFIHVRDAARAYKHAACNPSHWPELIYNVGSNNQNYQISEVANLVRNELDTNLDVTYLRDRQPGPSYHVNFDRLEETGFSTNWSVRQGVSELAKVFIDKQSVSETQDGY